MVSVIIKKSPKKEKKLRAIFTYDNGNKMYIDFGATGYMDYILYYKKDVTNANKRKKAYLKRHRPNENWNDYMSAGSLSRWILWNKPTLHQSLTNYKNKFNLK